MYKISCIVFVLHGVFNLVSAQPATDIFLFDLKVTGKKIELSNPRNITNKVGYDNQPFFHPTKSLLYYVSAFQEGRTDIMSYDFKTKTSRRLTETREREYSPTVTPDKKFLSCIVQRDSGAQDLVKYPIDGGEPIVMIDNLIVGYHAWADENNVMLFVLGEPNTFRKFSMNSKSEKTVDQNIGRSIHQLPDGNGVSYVQKQNADRWMIRKIEPDGTTKDLVPTLKGKEFFAWIGKDKLVMSDGTKLFVCDLKKDVEWSEIQLPPGLDLKQISRLAVSADSKKLAMVVNE